MKTRSKTQRRALMMMRVRVMRSHKDKGETGTGNNHQGHAEVVMGIREMVPTFTTNDRLTK